MPTLNTITAFLVGLVAAAIWAVVAIRRLLRSEGFARLTSKQRAVVWGFALLAFFPSVFIAFSAATALTYIVLAPGAWVRLALDLTVVATLGLVGAGLTLGAGFVAALVIRGASRRNENAA